MKINIMTGAFIPLPPAGYGAIERVWHGLAPIFAKKGHEVTFYARAHPTQASDETVDGVHYVRRREFKQTHSRLVNILIKDALYAITMLRILRPADIFISNDFCTGLIYPYWGSQRSGQLFMNIQRIPKRIMKSRYRKADCLLAVSNAVRDAIEEIEPLLLRKTYVVPNPVYTEIFRPPQNPRKSHAPQTLLYTGRIHPEKGLHLLTQAFEQIYPEFPHLNLKIVGPWRYEQGGGGPEYLNKLIGRNNLPIEIADPISDVNALAKLIQDANFYCYPSLAERGETFGVAALEASACGIPPIVSDLKCFREFVEDGINGFIFNHRADNPVNSLADTIRQMLTNGDKLEKMRIHAAQTAEAFCYEKVAEKYLKVFEKLLKPNSYHISADAGGSSIGQGPTE